VSPLSCVGSGDYETALREFRPLADYGDARAQTKLGYMYSEGLGVPQHYQEALRWYRLSADQGDASAQFNLGVLYNEGRGVLQDYQEAVKWFRLAAEQGNGSTHRRSPIWFKLTIPLKLMD